MATLLRFSEAAAMAIHGMVQLARHPDGRACARSLAQGSRSSETHMVKVCQRLVRAGLLRARRGAHGGFALARDPETIRLLDVYEAIEGTIVLTPCLFRDRTCHEHPGRECMIGCKIREFEEGFVSYLEATTLAEVVRRCPEEAGV